VLINTLIWRKSCHW